jgi:hypothetical protein
VIFDGETYTPRHDADRLRTLLQRVEAALRTGGWWTLAELRARCGGSEAGVSARLRDLRKERWGAHTVLRRRRGRPAAGLWEYRLVPRKRQQALFRGGAP